ncbi:ERG12 [Candida theae]|uniref:Mevalonate kinase n=1 Tax=Candida theae TaxID=1198502 RepID=A0AAD5FXU1_9ASCO|nr:ERG12 [Candida theae]KAI5955489.1 ERG12 [Candida theae]
MPSSPEPFIVSAPGKVIIFGEHSAVYGKPAIAAALSLRCFLLVTPSTDSNVIRLQFPDIELDHSWDKSSIKWDKIRQCLKFDKNGSPIPPSELVPEIVDDLSDMLGGFESNNVHHLACFCFLYLYVCLCNSESPGMTFVVRSTLPIGAGLGSSASTSVCLSAALSRLGGWIKDPRVHEGDTTPKQDIPDLEFIDTWSLIGEKCFHGNPSGIDNAVATHGGAVMFQRSSEPGKPSTRTNIRTLPPVKLLLTNTKVPKSTAKLVGGVGILAAKYNSIITPILESMGNLVQEAYRVMTHPNFGSEETAILRELVNINHGLLVGLGVSHPSLETVKLIGDEMKIGATKLTGAGGGGCAITLVNEDTQESVIGQAILEYERQGFESFETSLGGKGVGMLFQSDLVNDKKFSPELFCNYANRLEIETALAVENVPEWKFW